LSIAEGGTGSSTQNFVDLTSSQTIAGTKTFSSPIAASITGNAATATSATTATSAATASAVAFNGITSGSNTSATMTVGTGASLSPTGAGTITANFVPVSGGAAPTANGAIAYDSTAKQFKVGVNSASNTLALLGGGNAFTLGKQTLAASAATFASLNFPNSGVTPTTPAPAIGDMWLTTGDPHLQFQSAAGTTKSLAFTTDVGGGTVGGDLSGTVSNATVAKVNGVTYGATPSTNTVPVVTASNTVTYEQVPNAAMANSSTSVNGQTCTLGGSCTVTATPSGSAGGDLSGSYPSPTVAKINGSPLGTTTGASNGQVLAWDGTNNRWAPATVISNGGIAGGQITITTTQVPSLVKASCTTTDPSFTFTGATNTMAIVITPAGTLHATDWDQSGLTWVPYVSATNTVKVHVCNASQTNVAFAASQTFNVRFIN
jgi:hypothetical protein